LSLPTPPESIVTAAAEEQEQQNNNQNRGHGFLHIRIENVSQPNMASNRIGGQPRNLPNLRRSMIARRAAEEEKRL
jgi:hypothetical protein